MTRSLRIALVVNPFTLRRKGGDHAPVLSRELLGRGHRCRGFGAPPGVIPRSRIEANDEGLGLLGFRPDVVVAYDALSPAGWHGARAAQRLGVPLVSVEEGFPRVGRAFERTLRGVGETLWGPYVRRRAARVIALDGVARSEALDRGFPSDRVEVIPGGVDLNQFRPGLVTDLYRRHGIHGRVLLCTAPLDDEESLGALIDAFAASIGRREDWDLVFAAEGPAHYALRDRCHRLGVGSQVHWLGRPRREELPGLLASATLFCAPESESATQGRVVQRAMAAGLPILAADSPRYAGRVLQEDNGLRIAPKDAAAWTVAIQRAAGAPHLRERWAQRSRELATELFDWPQVTARISSLLLDVVSHQQIEAAASRGAADSVELREAAD